MTTFRILVVDDDLPDCKLMAKILVESQPGQGSVFQVVLPALLRE